MRHIVVLGGGFAGLHAIHTLENALAERRKVQITLINDSPSFLFTPLLPNVANGEIAPDTILLPLKEHLGQHTEFIQAKVTKLDLDAQELHAENHAPIPYDYLILATGSEILWPKEHDTWIPHAMTCKTLQDALLIRNTIESAFQAAEMMSPKERAQHLTFVFAGAGPTGIELATELWSSLKLDVFPHLSSGIQDATRFVVVDSATQILGQMPQALQKIAAKHLQTQGFELHLDTTVEQRTADQVTLSGGTTIPCDHFFWCAGIKPSELAQTKGFDLDDNGRIRTNNFLQALGHDNIYAIGDIAVPPNDAGQTAQAAKQQGPHAAENLIAALSGRAQTPWTFTQLGDLITLGRGKAGVHIKGITLEGLPAYAMYRVVYAGLMPTTMKKFKIMADWIGHDLARSSLPLLES